MHPPPKKEEEIVTLFTKGGEEGQGTSLKFERWRQLCQNMVNSSKLLFDIFTNCLCVYSILLDPVFFSFMEFLEIQFYINCSSQAALKPTCQFCQYLLVRTWDMTLIGPDA